MRSRTFCQLISAWTSKRYAMIRSKWPIGHQRIATTTAFVAYVGIQRTQSRKRTSDRIPQRATRGRRGSLQTLCKRFAEVHDCFDAMIIFSPRIRLDPLGMIIGVYVLTIPV